MPSRPPVHQPAHVKTYAQLRGSAAARGYDRKWLKLREAFLGANPLCKRCEVMGFAIAAEEVHHMQPIVERPGLRLSWENLMSVCKPCHLAIEGERRGAGAKLKCWSS